MNRGLIIRSLRETWTTTLLFGLALMLFECAISFVLPRFQQQFSQQWLQMAFIQNIIKAMVGTDIAGGAGPEIFSSIPWVHPVVLAVIWAHAIIFCTRVPAGEVDRGTADVLLSLPVTRWTLHISETAAWAGSALLLLSLGILGNSIGSALSGTPWHIARIAVVALNLLALYLAVGAFAWLMSALSDRRGRAIATAFVVVITSFLLNYLAQFWEPLERIAFLSILRYYRPVFALKDGVIPIRDILVLSAAAAALWTAAGVISARRDLTTT